MPRYIDLEELEKRINENIKPDTPEEKALIEWCKDECIRQGYAMPRADVAPRSEVAKEIFEEINVTWSESYGVGEFFEDIAELKKKYTEGEK